MDLFISKFAGWLPQLWVSKFEILCPSDDKATEWQFGIPENLVDHLLLSPQQSLENPEKMTVI